MKKLAVAVIVVIAACESAWAFEYCFISEHGYVFDVNRTMIRFDARFQSFSGLTNSFSLTDDVTPC